MRVVVSDSNSVVSNGVFCKPGSAIEIDDAEALVLLQRGAVRLPPVVIPPDPYSASLPPDVVAKRRVAAIAAAEAQQLATLGLTYASLGVEKKRDCSLPMAGVPWW
jgi:hypothetical protein